jgi:hypothetical protein
MGLVLGVGVSVHRNLTRRYPSNVEHKSGPAITILPRTTDKGCMREARGPRPKA